MRACARAFLVGLAFVLAASWWGGASALMVPLGMPGLRRKAWDRCEVACVGKVRASRRVDQGVAWWREFLPGDDVEEYEAEFEVERVVRGPEALEGRSIIIRYPMIVERQPPGREASPAWGFSLNVGEERCLVLVNPGPEGTYRLVGLGAYIVLGPRPPAGAWDGLKPEERLDVELAGAVLSPEERTAVIAMEAARDAALCGARTMDALLRRRADPDLYLRGAAIEALIRMGHLETILRLRDEIAGWPDTERARRGLGAIWNGVRVMKDPTLVPILAELSLCDARVIREAAVEALALYQSQSADVVPALVPFLDDESPSTRHHAVMGLAAATDRLNPEWAWGYPHFLEDPDPLVRKWKTWWETEGRAKYPSLEDVLKKAEALRREHAEKQAAPAVEAP